MKIFCKELNQDFETPEQMFKALLDNKDKIIGLKKAAIKCSEEIPAKFLRFKDDVETKALGWVEKDYLYPVINTTNLMDSHSDVHLKGIWNKSIKEQQGSVHYVVEHELKVSSVIAYPKDVEIMVKDIDWKDLGQGFEGTTQALIFKTNVFDYSNDSARKAIEHKAPVQHSVRMQYVKVELAINSKSPDFLKEKEAYDKYLPEIVNKDVVEKQGYFWAVAEAKIYKEGSMVLFGSNSVTPMIEYSGLPPSGLPPAEPPQKGTQNEPSADTRKVDMGAVKSILKTFKNLK